MHKMYTLSQLLFYNAKLMYRSIIVMDFLGFSIFDKKYKKKSRNAATSEFIYHYLIINEVLIQNLLESRFLQFFFFFFYEISVVNLNNNGWSWIVENLPWSRIQNYYNKDNDEIINRGEQTTKSETSIKNISSTTAEESCEICLRCESV